MYSEPSSKLQRFSFAPSLPLKTHSSTPKRKSFSAVHSYKIPRANCPILKRKSGVMPKVFPAQDTSLAGWLTERQRWKLMQQTGLQTVDTHLQTYDLGSDSTEPFFQAVNLVKLSLSPVSPPGLSVRKKEPSVKTDMGKPQELLDKGISYRYLQPRVQTYTDYLKKPEENDYHSFRGRILRKSEQECLYQDPDTHKIFAYVTVPSPMKSVSGKSSTRNTTYPFQPPQTEESDIDHLTPRPPSGSSPSSVSKRKFTPKATLFQLDRFNCTYEAAVPPCVVQHRYSRCSSMSREKTDTGLFAVQGKGLESQSSRGNTPSVEAKYTARSMARTTNQEIETA